MELADPARLDPSGLARMEERLLRTLEHRGDVQRVEQRLDDAFRAEEPGREDSGHPPGLVRQVPRDGQVHPRDLEQLDLPGARVEVPAHGLDEAR